MRAGLLKTPTTIAAAHRPDPLLLGAVRIGAPDRVNREAFAFEGGRLLGGHRLSAEGEYPPQPSPKHQPQQSEAYMVRLLFHQASSQARGDEAAMKSRELRALLIRAFGSRALRRAQHQTAHNPPRPRSSILVMCPP